MRILQVSHYFLPKHKAGVETYTYNLSKELQKKHDIWIYTREDDHFDKDFHEAEDSYDGLKIKRIYYNIPLTFDTAYKNEAIDKHFFVFLDKIKPDVVHFQHLERLSVNLIRIVKAKNIPVILTLHDYWFICPQIQLLRDDGKPCCPPYGVKKCIYCVNVASGMVQTRIRNEIESKFGFSAAVLRFIGTKFKWFALRGAARSMNRLWGNDSCAILERKNLMRQMLNEADVIISPSKFLRKKFIDFAMPSEDIIYLKYGVNKKFLSKFKKGALERIRFGYVGTIIRHKGVRLLMDAFNKIKNEKVELNIFGEGYDSYFQKIMVKIKKDERIKYMGPFEYKNAVEVYSQIDVLVVPSIWYENAPLVIQEAFCTKTPVIASDIGGIPELVVNMRNGLLFKNGDVKSLLSQMCKVIDNPLLIKKFQKNIEDMKTIEKNAEELEGIYRHCISKKHKTYKNESLKEPDKEIVSEI